MKLDTGLFNRDLRKVGAAAKAAEEAGFDALWTLEAGNDGFLPLVLAAEHTQRIKLGTAVAIAFPRSPMSTAYVAWDLAGLSNGRFILGLGTQVKGHIERRYSVKWEPPVPKLREYVGSLRSIFKSWSEGGKKLSYSGKYYNFSLMTPFFTPEHHKYDNIPIYIAGVNPIICRTAGEICEGLHAHPFHSTKFLREQVLTHVEEGLRRSGRSRSQFTIVTSAFVIVGRNDSELDAAREGVRRQISFYASTRAYQSVLQTHGWTDVAARLNEKAAKGDWSGMAAEITDEMLEVYAISGTPDDIGAKVKARYEGLLDRVMLYVPYRSPFQSDDWKALTKQFNG